MASNSPSSDTHRDPPSGSEAAQSLRCSFCGKRRDEVETMVAGSRWEVAICNECVALCVEIIAEQRADAERPQSPNT